MQGIAAKILRLANETHHDRLCENIGKILAESIRNFASAERVGKLEDFEAHIKRGAFRSQHRIGRVFYMVGPKKVVVFRRCY